jgi:hypothetical protein
MMQWQLEEKLSLMDFWKLPTSIFEKKLENLIDYIHWKHTERLSPNRPYFTAKGREITKKIKDQRKKKWDFEA